MLYLPCSSLILLYEDRLRPVRSGCPQPGSTACARRTRRTALLSPKSVRLSFRRDGRLLASA
ncbi:MAG TPA: hypothetical protein VF482_00335 [Trebonia sp.]